MIVGISQEILAISKPEVQDFLRSNEHLDERQLVLSRKTMFGVPTSRLADQIAGRRKAKEKLPEFYRQIGIVYPPAINLEQSSSELAAKFKARLAISENCRTIADLTGGFGIDAYYMSRAVDRLDYIEPNETLNAISIHNNRVLQAKEIFHHSQTAESFLTSSRVDFDLIFIDPSRRDGGKKLFKLQDCVPDVVSMKVDLLKRGRKVLVKASPLLDLQQGCAELASVERIFVVASENECKEVLFLCSAKANGEPVIECINLTTSGSGEERFTSTFANEREAHSEFSDPLTYLYEPHSWILKAGVFKLIGQTFGLAKLQVNTHLYTSANLRDNFPGRVFRIEGFKADAGLSSYFPGNKANVMTRNYPLSPDQLKKKYKLRDGGDRYLIAFSGIKQKFLAAAERIY